MTFPKNKNMTNALFIVVALISALQFACIYDKTRPAGIGPTAFETKPLPYKKLGRAEASVSNYDLLGLYTITPLGNAELALLAAVNSKGGDAIIDLDYTHNKTIWWVGTVNEIKISGEVIQYIDGSKKPIETKTGGGAP